MTGFIFVVAVALVDSEGHVLLSLRPKDKHKGDMWEFPGGKVDAGETPEQALVRELKEELGIDVQESCLAPFTFVSHAYPEKHVLLMLYLCRKWQGVPQPLQSQALCWKKPLQMRELPMPEADAPLVAMLRDFL